MKKFKKLPTQEQIAKILHFSFMVSLMKEGHMSPKEVFMLNHSKNNVIRCTKKEKEEAINAWNKFISKKRKIEIILPE